MPEIEVLHETDERFPSGPWKGFFLQKEHPGRNWMSLDLAFSEGKIVGAGSDWVGKFVIAGQYDVADGICSMEKRYLNRHCVYYRGFNEGKGIWGTWRIADLSRGGFYIWPQAMPDPTTPRLEEEAELPAEVPAEPVAAEDPLVRSRTRG